MRKTPLEEGQRWLEQAQEDLKWAGRLAEQGGYHLACFHAQQVAELALKAFLFARGEEIVLGHSVERLCSSAAGHDPAFGDKSNTWSVLDGYYVAARYPNSLPDSIPARVFTAEAADRAVDLARETVEFVRQKLAEQN